MKTFSEACAAVLMRRTPDDTIPADLDEASAKFHDTHEEIQTSDEAKAFAHCLIHQVGTSDMDAEEAIRIAFSHGVMVGMVMERAE